MKNVIEIQENPIINTFRDGFIIKATIEGRLNNVHEKKHKNVKKGLESHDCHFRTTSDIHQKLGTFSW
jgi:hypothetical protein